MNHTPLYKTAIILFVALSFISMVLSLPALLNGPENQIMATGIPQAVILLDALTGVAGLITGYGAWKGQKWGIWLTIILSAIGGLSALPGVLFAPNTIDRISAIVGVVASIFIIVVLLHRPKPATS